jgi:hypothetical protein
MSYHSYCDNLLNAALLKLEVEVGIGNPFWPQCSWITTSPVRARVRDANRRPHMSSAKMVSRSVKVCQELVH